jgi:hypothetical protein
VQQVLAMLDLQGLGQQSPVSSLGLSTSPTVPCDHIFRSKSLIIVPKIVSASGRKQSPSKSSYGSFTVRSSQGAQSPLVKKSGETGVGGVELTEYKDSYLDLLFINGCRKTFGRVADWQVRRLADPDN